MKTALVVVLVTLLGCASSPDISRDQVKEAYGEYLMCVRVHAAAMLLRFFDCDMSHPEIVTPALIGESAVRLAENDHCAPEWGEFTRQARADLSFDLREKLKEEARPHLISQVLEKCEYERSQMTARR